MDATKNATISGGAIVERMAAFEPSHLFSSGMAPPAAGIALLTLWGFGVSTDH